MHSTSWRALPKKTPDTRVPLSRSFATNGNRRMNPARILLLALTLAALSACQPKATAPAAAGDTSPPVATVNGAPISRDFYEFYIKGISGKTSADLTAEQRGEALDRLIRARSE